MSPSALPDYLSSRPGSSLAHQEIRQLAHWLAQFLDATWIIPGTTIKIGLDPLLGLIPGFGDILSNAVGSLLLFLATKAGVPRIVIARMALNVCINMAMGVIPGIGVVFSIWFKSNLRNAQLLDRHCRSDGRAVALADWTYVGAVLGLMLALMVGILGGVVWAVSSLMEFLRTLPT
ncbi:MAG: DUF4112 domain-containing protein [Nitrospirales bacterium]|nr:DUF4112 domain-containing protein [Nitrospirales bacterium]